MSNNIYFDPTTGRRVVTTIEVVTPNLACEWLQNNNFNRPVRNAHVTMVASELSSGRWRLNGESVIFDHEGNLLDGQHRLWAIVESSTAAPTVVVRGVAKESFATIDSGVKRTGGDVLALLGVKNSTSTASAIRLIHFVASGASNDRLINKMSSSQCASLLSTYPEAEEAAALIAGATQVRAMMPPSPASAMMYFALKTDRDKAMEFFDGLARGANLQPGDPRLACRTYFLTRKHAKRVTVKTQLAVLIKAWNAFLQDRDIKVMKYFPSETFPLPLGFVPTARAGR